jgi:hypothetical protein
MASADDGTKGLSYDIWHDVPLLNMAVDPMFGITAGDDFTNITTTGFPYLITGINPTFLSATADPYGIGVLTATGADNDACYVSYNNGLAGLIKAGASHDWAFEVYVKPSQITLAQGVFVGLVGEAQIGTDLIATNTMALKVQDYIGFQIIAATDVAAIWQSVYCKTSGARVAVNATAATAAVSYIKLGMKCVSGTVYFYVNGAVQSASVINTATNFPLNVVMCPTFATKCGQATVNTLKVDWWRASQYR